MVALVNSSFANFVATGGFKRDNSVVGWRLYSTLRAPDSRYFSKLTSGVLRK